MDRIPGNDSRFSGRKRNLHVQIFILAVALFSLSIALPASAQSLLWEVKSDTATVYLFGSVHYARSDMYPLDAAVEDSFDKSSILVLELDPLSVDQTKVLQEVLSKGMYPGDKTIKDELDSEVYAMLEEYLKSAGLPMASFMKMKPALLSITLSTLRLQELGYSPDQGIDIYFAKKATGNKPILELESAQEQMDLLFNLPDADLYLKYTIMDNSKTSGQIESIMEAWKSGDADKMNALINEETLQEHPELGALMDEILFKRNRRMVKKIREYLAGDKTYFVVVGAAHLVGDQGIAKLLETAGYEIRKF